MRKPSAAHTATWMSQIQYSQKMYLRRDQRAYSEEFLSKLKQINIFLALFYVPAWQHSNIGSDFALVNRFFFERHVLVQKG